MTKILRTANKTELFCTLNGQKSVYWANAGTRAQNFWVVDRETLAIYSAHKTFDAAVKAA